MAKVKDLKLQGGVRYNAFCYGSDAPNYSFSSMVTNMHLLKSCMNTLVGPAGVVITISPYMLAVIGKIMNYTVIPKDSACSPT
jgi:hypothetical protein